MFLLFFSPYIPLPLPLRPSPPSPSLPPPYPSPFLFLSNPPPILPPPPSPQVFFVDYGNIELVPLDGLCAMASMDMREPAKAFECHLTGVKPAPPYEHFCPEAGARLDQLVFNKQLMAKVWGAVCSEIS